MEDGNHKFVLINRMTEVKDALWRMKMEKAIVPMKCQLKFGSARVMWVSASWQTFVKRSLVLPKYLVSGGGVL